MSVWGQLWDKLWGTSDTPTGKYSIQLTVGNAGGTSTLTKTDYISFGTAPPPPPPPPTEVFIKPYAVVDAMYQAGFRYGKGLTIGLAVAWAESRFNATATHTNADGSVDRGLWQINSVAYPNVTNAQAFDPLQSSKLAWTISKSGTDFTPWSAYGDGGVTQPYRAYMETARYVVACYYAIQLKLPAQAKKIVDDAP